MNAQPSQSFRNFEAARRLSLRTAKGRPSVVYRQWRPDWRHHPMVDTTAPDPILDLMAARSWAIAKPCDPATQQRYGELLQRVVSPVFLP